VRDSFLLLAAKSAMFLAMNSPTLIELPSMIAAIPMPTLSSEHLFKFRLANSFGSKNALPCVTRNPRISLKRSLAGVVKKHLLMVGGAAAVGLTGGLCLEAVLAFLVCWAFPFLRVSTMVRV